VVNNDDGRQVINACPEVLLAGVVNDTIEQLHQELDVEAGKYVVDLVELLHRRRQPRTPRPDCGGRRNRLGISTSDMQRM
jgi:hypothetical protein